MFDGKRYTTNGVIDKIPSYLQNVLWYMVEILPEPKDYFQVFELEEFNYINKVKQKITHIQENPEYKKEHIIPVYSAVKCKVYIIDDGDHSTMLMAEEY